MIKNLFHYSNLQHQSSVKCCSAIWAKIQEPFGRLAKYMRTTTYWFIWPINSMDTSAYPIRNNFTWAVGITISVLMSWSNSYLLGLKSNFISNTSILTCFTCFRIYCQFMIETLRYFWKSSTSLIIRVLLRTHSITRKRKKSLKPLASISQILYLKKLSIIMFDPFIEYCSLWFTES